MFASVGSVLKLHTWSDNQLEQIATFTPKKNHGTESKIINVSWCHDNSYIALLLADSQPQIVSSKDKRCINLVHTINALKEVTAVTFKNHTKRNVALANKLGEIVIYDTKNRNINSKIACLPGPIKLLEYNYHDEQLAISSDSTLNIFVEQEGMNGFIKEIPQRELSTAIRYHPSIPNLIAVGGENGCISLWDTDKGEKLGRYHKHSSAITGIGFSRNQKMMVTTGMDNKICVLDNTSSDCLFRMSVHQAVTSMDISPDDLYIAAGLEDGCVCIYDVREPLKYLVCAQVHNTSVNKISFEKGPLMVESLHDGHSITTINGSDFCDNKVDVTNTEVKHANNFEDNLKKELFKVVKTHMNYLETQLAEHCAKFQSFINKEFDSIHNAMGRWDVFNVGDTNEIVQAIDTTEVKSTKSASTRKSTSY